MSLASKTKLARSWHRRLVPLAFLPILFWSIGGLMAAWQGLFAGPEATFVGNAPAANLKQENFLVPITPIARNSRLAMIKEIRIGKMLNVPVYRLIMDQSHAETYDAITGELLSPLDKTAAVAIAKATFERDVIVKSVTQVDSWTAHYSGPIPAWRISIASMLNREIYVATNTGEITARESMFTPLTNYFAARQGTAGRTLTSLWIQALFSIAAIGAANYGIYLWYATTLTGRKKPKRRPGRRKN